MSRQRAKQGKAKYYRSAFQLGPRMSDESSRKVIGGSHVLSAKNFLTLSFGSAKVTAGASILANIMVKNSYSSYIYIHIHI